MQTSLNRNGRRVLGLGLALLAPADARAQEEQVDLELILAVDASSSVSTEEFDLLPLNSGGRPIHLAGKLRPDAWAGRGTQSP